MDNRNEKENRKGTKVNYSKIHRIYGTELFLSNVLSTKNEKELRKLGIRTIMSCGTPPLINHGFIKYYRIKLRDSETEEIYQYFETSFRLIEERLKKGGILVHCRFGVSRSSTIVACYLIKKFNLTFKQAIKRIKRTRKFIRPNKGFVKQLKEWKHELTSGYSSFAFNVGKGGTKINESSENKKEEKKKFSRDDVIFKKELKKEEQKWRNKVHRRRGESDGEEVIKAVEEITWTAGVCFLGHDNLLHIPKINCVPVKKTDDCFGVNTSLHLLRVGHSKILEAPEQFREESEFSSIARVSDGYNEDNLSSSDEDDDTMEMKKPSNVEKSDEGEKKDAVISESDTRAPDKKKSVKNPKANELKLTKLDYLRSLVKSNFMDEESRKIFDDYKKKFVMWDDSNEKSSGEQIDSEMREVSEEKSETEKDRNVKGEKIEVLGESGEGEIGKGGNGDFDIEKNEIYLNSNQIISYFVVIIHERGEKGISNFSKLLKGNICHICKRYQKSEERKENFVVFYGEDGDTKFSIVVGSEEIVRKYRKYDVGMDILYLEFRHKNKDLSSRITSVGIPNFPDMLTTENEQKICCLGNPFNIGWNGKEYRDILRYNFERHMLGKTLEDYIWDIVHLQKPSKYVIVSKQLTNLFRGNVRRFTKELESLVDTLFKGKTIMKELISEKDSFFIGSGGNFGTLKRMMDQIEEKNNIDGKNEISFSLRSKLRDIPKLITLIHKELKEGEGLEKFEKYHKELCNIRNKAREIGSYLDNKIFNPLLDDRIKKIEEGYCSGEQVLVVSEGKTLDFPVKFDGFYDGFSGYKEKDVPYFIGCDLHLCEGWSGSPVLEISGEKETIDVSRSFSTDGKIKKIKFIGLVTGGWTKLSKIQSKRDKSYRVGFFCCFSCNKERMREFFEKIGVKMTIPSNVTLE